MLLGLCGREGAGKTTVARMLCPAPPAEYDKLTLRGEEVEQYLLRTLFPKVKAKHDWLYSSYAKLLLNLLRQHIDTQYCYPETAEIYQSKTSDDSSSIEYGMADPLKKAAAVIFTIDYLVLLGDTPERRELRESVTTREYDICGKLTGRKCLEYLGTDVFRHHDPDFWIELARQNIEAIFAKTPQARIVISDIRFPNELELLQCFARQSLRTELWLIYKKEEDLILSKEDRQQHPAKWTFLTFSDAPHLRKLLNNGSLEELEGKVNQMLLMK
jgi:energy-coupling factor transporter ATP-binding protein EcfA2